MANNKTNADSKYGKFVREVNTTTYDTRWMDKPDQIYGGWLPNQRGAGEDIYYGMHTWDPNYYGDERDSFINAYNDTSGDQPGSGEGVPTIELNWDKMPALERGVKGYEQYWLNDDEIEFDENGKPHLKDDHDYLMGGFHNKDEVYWDPNYGWYTPNTNFTPGKLGSTIGSLMMMAFSGPMWSGIWSELAKEFPLLAQLATNVGNFWDKLTAPFDEFVEGFKNALSKGWQEVTSYLESVGLDPNGLEISSDAARSLGLDVDFARDGISPTGPNGGYTLTDISKITEFSGPPNVIDPLQEPVSDPKPSDTWDYADEPWPDLNDLGDPATGNDYGLTTNQPPPPTINADGTGGVVHDPNWKINAAATTAGAGAAKKVFDIIKDVVNGGGTIDDILNIIRDVAPGILQYLSAEDFEDWLNGYMTDEALWKKLDPFGDQRAFYQDRLKQVVENPEQFFKNDPGYQFLMNEALRAAQASAGPYGRYGSSNAAQWAQDRALGTAATQRFNEISALSPLAGAQFGPDSYAGLYRDAFKAAGEARKGMYTGLNQAAAGALGENTNRGTGTNSNANLITTGIDLAKGLYDTIFGK